MELSDFIAKHGEKPNEVVDETNVQAQETEQPQEQQQEVEDTTQEETTEQPQEAVAEQQEETQESQDESSFTYGSNSKGSNEPSNDSNTQGFEITDDVLLSRLSEKLGKELTSFDDLKPTTNKWFEDQEIAKIIEFKEKTNRSLNDFMLYQSIDTSEMDDMNAVQLKYQLEYPELTYEERQELIKDAYKLDEDEYDESVVKRAKVRLKADAVKAKKEIEAMRKDFLLPKQVEQQADSINNGQQEESIFDDKWKSDRARSIDGINVLRFNVEGSDEPFNIALTNEMKQSIKGINPEGIFDRYIDDNDNWNHNLFNADQVVLNNIQTIVNNAIKHGISIGQKKIVETASNASSKSPSEQGGVTENAQVRKQAQEILQRIHGGTPKMSIGGSY